MPVVAMIGSIAIMFFYDDHDPPHCHARSPEFKAKIALADLALIEVQGRARPADIRAIRR